MSLAKKYRPRRFCDVEGQDHAVRILSQLILRGQHRVSCLLYGSIGSGKTTLSRIYGKALNCLDPQVDGSPCEICLACKTIPLLEEDGTAFGMNGLSAKQQLSEMIRDIPTDYTKVLFIDEAHALGSSLEVLLKPLEVTDTRLVVILATTKPNSIPTAIRSRLQQIEIKPFSTSMSISFLEMVCAREEIIFEPEALALLASYSDGQPRDLLQNLDQARIFGEVTLASVADRVGLAYNEALANYWRSLASGGFEGLARSFYDWNDTVQTKMSLVQSLLLAVYLEEVHGLAVMIEPVFTSIPKAIRRATIAIWKNRVGGAFAEHLRTLIAFWPVAMPDQTDAAVALHFSMFHELASDLCADTKTIPTAQPRRSTRDVITTPGRFIKPAFADPQYLNLSQARHIVNTASSMTQAYGHRFNARIVLWHRAFDRHDADSAAALNTQFNGFIRNYLKSDYAASGYRLTVQGCDDVNGFWTRVVAAVPSVVIDTLPRALGEWKKEQRVELASGAAAIDYLRIEKKGKTGVFHRKCLRWMCEGIDPKLLWTDGKREPVSLVELLGVPNQNRRPFGSIGVQKRFGETEALSTSAFEKQTVNQMSFLHAFDLAEWDQVGGDWEIFEHRDRKKLGSVDKGRHPHAGGCNTEEAAEG